MKNKFVIITRDWKGDYGNMKYAHGYILVGGEGEIETGGDCFAMVFSQNPTERTAQQIYDIRSKLQDDVESYDGCRFEKYVDDPIIED